MCLPIHVHVSGSCDSNILCPLIFKSIHYLQSLVVYHQLARASVNAVYVVVVCYEIQSLNFCLKLTQLNESNQRRAKLCMTLKWPVCDPDQINQTYNKMFIYNVHILFIYSNYPSGVGIYSFDIVSLTSYTLWLYFADLFKLRDLGIYNLLIIIGLFGRCSVPTNWELQPLTGHVQHDWK